MYLVYYIAMVTVGSAATDWANDGLFGDGWHLFGIGTSEYTEVADNYTAASEAISAYYELDTEADDFDPDTALADMKAVQPDSASATIEVEDEETLAMNDMTVYYDAIPADADEETTVGMSYLDAVTYFEENGFDEPDPADYGVWVPGVPVLIGNALEAAGAAEWLNGLILDGIVAGVGAVLGLRAPDAGAVPDAGVPGGLRLHGPYRLRSGPYLPQVRPVRQVLHPHAHRHRLRHPRYHGFPYH